MQDRGETGGRYFDAVYKRCRTDVLAIALSRCRNADTAEEALQEAFSRLWQRWLGGERLTNPRAWLTVVALNWIEDHRKSSFRRNGTQPPETMNAVRSDEPTPLELVTREEESNRLRAALSQLPDHYREVCVRKRFEDQSVDEIASELKISRNAVKRMLRSAYKRLRVLLSDLSPDTGRNSHRKAVS